ncbi:hypothetical protein KIPB_014103, partial [Kipferlia bialata]|eukprot:g14103.t1
MEYTSGDEGSSIDDDLAMDLICLAHEPPTSSDESISGESPVPATTEDARGGGAGEQPGMGGMPNTGMGGMRGGEQGRMGPTQPMCQGMAMQPTQGQGMAIQAPMGQGMGMQPPQGPGMAMQPPMGQ